MTQTQIAKKDIIFENHKWGAKIVSVYTYTEGNPYPTGRKTLGAIKRYNDRQFEALGYRFLTNDWTAPEFIDGKHNEAKVARHQTRKEAMDRLLALA